jgi:ribosomal protein S18 acetylase RimI-like enzyme
VREGEAGDLERIAEIKVRSWKDTYAPLVPADVLGPFLDYRTQLQELLASTAAKDAILLVAEVQPGNVVGFALTHMDRPPEPWLESLHVLPEFQGQGAGTLLMRATAAHIKRRGGSTMRLGVVAGNLKAERFYERLSGASDSLEPADWAPAVMHHIYRWPNLDVLA